MTSDPAPDLDEVEERNEERGDLGTLAVQARVGAGKVAALGIQGRPPRSHGASMGDHTSAFVLQKRLLESEVRGKSLTEALTNVCALGTHLGTLPGAQPPSGSHPATPERARFDQALASWNRSVAEIRALLTTTPTPSEGVLHSALQALSARYLVTREAVPLTTVAPVTGGAKGKGESVEALDELERCLHRGTAIGPDLRQRGLHQLDSTFDSASAGRLPADQATRARTQHELTLVKVYPLATAFLRDGTRPPPPQPGAQPVEGGADAGPGAVTSHQVQIRIDLTSGQIADVRFAGRPRPDRSRDNAGESGLEGNHISAWILRQELLRKTLVGKKVAEACQIVTTLDGVAERTPPRSSLTDLQDGIVEHLEALTLDPLVVQPGLPGKGRGEGTAMTALRTLESEATTRKFDRRGHESVLAHFATLIDLKPLADMPLSQQDPRKQARHTATSSPHVSPMERAARDHVALLKKVFPKVTGRLKATWEEGFLEHIQHEAINGSDGDSAYVGPVTGDLPLRARSTRNAGKTPPNYVED